MRPDLYRPVNAAVPRWKYSLSLLARDFFQIEPVSLQIAERNSQTIGAVFVQSIPRNKLSWSVFEKEAYLDNIVVKAEFRRQGIGTALLAAAQQWAKKTGHTHLWGKIITENGPSLSMFEKAGFTVDSKTVGLHLS